MAGMKLAKSQWLAALAAGVAGLALAAPANAQHWRERGGEGVQPAAEHVERAAPAERPAWRGNNDGGQATQGWSRPERAQVDTGAWQARQAERAAQQQADNSAWQARQAERAAQAQANNSAWQARQAERAARTQADSGWGARGNGDTPSWRGRQAEVAPQASVEAKAERPQWQGRNPTYVDPSRQATVTNRDDNWNRNRDRSADNDRRYRDNTWWNGNRDGVRNWRDSQNHPDANLRQRYREAYANDRYRNGYSEGWRDNSRRWDRDWRRDNRYDWYSWRNRNRTTFSIGYYYSPYRDYRYRRLNIGYYLDSLFFSSRYWIADPWRYRLPEVYGPYRWVRYYDDVLLVDIYSGEVVDAIYDFFY